MAWYSPGSNTPVQYFKKFDPTPPISTTELKKFEGIYTSVELETEYKLTVKDDAFFLRINNDPVRQLFPPTEEVVWNSKHMVWIGFAEIIFDFDMSGNVIGFTIGDSRVKGVQFMRNR